MELICFPSPNLYLYHVVLEPPLLPAFRVSKLQCREEYSFQSFSMGAEGVVQSMGGVYTFTLLAKWAVITNHPSYSLLTNPRLMLNYSLHARTSARTRLLPGSKEDAYQSIHLSRLPIKVWAPAMDNISSQLLNCPLNPVDPTESFAIPFNTATPPSFPGQ